VQAAAAPPGPRSRDQFELDAPNKYPGTNSARARIDLQTQTKHAHLNVKGPTFIALHELFDKVNEAVEDYMDEIAERAVRLGGVAEGTAAPGMDARRAVVRARDPDGWAGSSGAGGRADANATD
jgi:hypothetical protein